MPAANAPAGRNGAKRTRPSFALNPRRLPAYSSHSCFPHARPKNHD
jgi:hypothetical protein